MGSLAWSKWDILVEEVADEATLGRLVGHALAAVDVGITLAVLLQAVEGG